VDARLVFPAVRPFYDHHINLNFFKKRFLGGFMKFRFLLTLALSLLLSACVRERLEPISDQMKQQLALLPQEADVLGYINLEQIQHSSVSRVIMDSARTDLFRNRKFEEFKSVTGFDFQKDARSIYFAFGLSGKGKGMNGIFVVQGNFDPEKIIAFINSKDTKKQVVAEPYNTFKIYRSAERQAVFCFPDPHTLIAGKETSVKTWLDKSTLPPDGKISQEWLPRIEAVKYKNGLWLVMTTRKFSELMDQEHSLPKNFQGLKNIKNGSFSIDFSDQLSFYGQGECLDPEKATLLSDAVKGLLASAKLAVSDERDMVDIINKVSVQSKGDKVTVQFKMTAEEIEKLVQKRKAYAKFGGASND
jgi:hypothetical protein